jgi:DNA-binding transcriptional LysR family regulator
LQCGEGAVYLAQPVLTGFDGLGFLMIPEGYTIQAVAHGSLSLVLEEWSVRFPAPFLYYPSRRQPPGTLTTFVAFVKEWRKRRGRQSR